MARVYPTRRRRAHILVLIHAASTLLTPTAAQATTYYFSGAVQVSSSSSGTTYSPAVAAQCPADHPIACTNLNEPGYCCPSANTCAWSNSQVACCPSGQTCAGSVGGVGGYQASTYYQTSAPTVTTEYVQQSTYYTPATTTVTNGGGVVVPAGYTQVTTVQTQQYVTGGYCSTLVANGPNLPTTAAGDCGTVLVIAPGEGARLGLGWVKVGMLFMGLQVLGGGLYAWR
ncbi:hypothetical protein LTR08_001745 [Meristemomyces frigidus]|nr:hypothetical protein LTR08_001745 [Meristemomyces frigidus]